MHIRQFTCNRMSLSNLALITFLAQKNTPLRLLTSYSYERLNKLHQIGGYTTITYTLLHLTLMCIRYSGINEVGIFIERAQIYGIIAAIAMVIILITATVLRKIQYEAFYVFHITMYGLVMVGVGMHRPSGSLKAAIITTVAGCIWAFDHIVRGCRLIRNIQHSATVTPLPHGSTRIVLHQPPSRAMPGCHCFLWAPKIRLFQSHPFTIVSTAPQCLELVITARDGFTKALHQYALLNPGAKLRASIDGPYGRPPIFLEAVDEVILIAGGSGASFTFGIALSMIRKLGGLKPTSIHFIWTVKKHGG
jgi:predicted ferric reductase